MFRTKQNSIAPTLASLETFASYQLVEDVSGISPDDVVSHVDVAGRAVAVVRVREVWCEVPIADGWRAAYRIVPSRKRRLPSVGEVRIFPAEEGRSSHGRWSAEELGVRARCPEGGIDSRVMKAFRLGAVVPFVNGLLGQLQLLAAAMPAGKVVFRTVNGQTGATSNEPGPGAAVHRALLEGPLAEFRAPAVKLRAKAPGRGAPRTVPDSQLAQVARRYREAIDAGVPKAADAVAKEFGLKSDAHARVMVRRDAAARGLIVSAGAGSRSWSLTPKAQALLAQADASQQIATEGKTRGKKAPEVPKAGKKNARHSRRRNSGR